MSAIDHSHPRIRFDAGGILIRPWLFAGFRLRWADLDFVSPTPIYEQVDGRWRPKPTPEYLLGRGVEDPVQELVRAGILELKVAVHDRRMLPRWTSVSVGAVHAKPLLDADDRPEAARGVVTLHLHTRRLSAGVDSLFDLLSARCRFGLIVSRD